MTRMVIRLVLVLPEYYYLLALYLVFVLLGLDVGLNITKNRTYKFKKMACIAGQK